MRQLKKFEEAHQSALQDIQRFLSKPEMAGLVKWLLETDANPYSFLPEQWAGAISTSTGFSGLLHCIAHALYDDGEMAFVSVNGQPRIVFIHPAEDNFASYVLSDQERTMALKYGSTYEVKVLKIAPNQFGPLYDAWHKEDIKACFLSDAYDGDTKSNDAKSRIEWAAAHYRHYACWDEGWIKEAEAENKEPKTGNNIRKKYLADFAKK